MSVDFLRVGLLLDEAIRVRAEAAKDWLEGDALNRPGTGLLHSGQPSRSSAQDEYPAEQLGNLRASIDARSSGRLTWAVGSFEEVNAQGYAEAVQLESRPPAAGGRPFIAKALAEGELRDILSGVTL